VRFKTEALHGCYHISYAGHRVIGVLEDVVPTRGVSLDRFRGCCNPGVVNYAAD